MAISWGQRLDTEMRILGIIGQLETQPSVLDISLAVVRGATCVSLVAGKTTVTDGIRNKVFELTK